MKENKKNIIHAMSGGVDSSTAAAILKDKGYNVAGLFLIMHKTTTGLKDAKQIAKQLDIPLKVLDVKKQFTKKVVDYFIKEYEKGRTPNPCVECNKHIKFKFLFNIAEKQKYQYISTGHYAKTTKNTLLKAKDKTKDQSYFLWPLTKKQIQKTIFPLGEYTKEEIRKIAKKKNLSIHQKKESQEACFVQESLNQFLKKNIKTKKGPIKNTKGEIIGEHQGLPLYTIGQRRGIRIGGIGPFYVVKKDFKNNALIVAQGDFNKELFKKQAVIEKTNWITKPKLPAKCNIKIRYLTKETPGIIKKQNKNYLIEFNKPQRAVTPGQSAVFYKKDQILGGGIIK
ncbi:MAG: tRNA 2-thiouridine(34) synthase MnmA [Candidatus Portnoybacteria bacterium]|nr:tRNA 2-thiouridine(34) synthase MnmA [Candidatus Portnoybacteria bacterium]